MGWTGLPWFDSRQGQEIFFSSLQHPDRLWSPHSLLSNGNGSSFPGVKRLEGEAAHPPPSSANDGATSLLPHTSSWSDA
jgi:hypothetical protein